MHLMGAALAAAVCVGGGLISARHLAARALALESWERALMRMYCALKMGGAALPELLGAGAARGPDTLGALKTRIETASAQEPAALLAGLPRDPLLMEEEQEVIMTCLADLFAPTPEMQLQALSCAQAQWAPLCQRARERLKGSARLYRQLGWLAGAAAFILLC